MNEQPGWMDELARYGAPLAGLFLILVVAPFFYTTALRDIFTLPKALPAAIGVATIWLGLSCTGEATFKRRLTPAILAMSAAALLSAMLSVDAPLSILGPHEQQFYALLPMALYALTYYAAANAENIAPLVVFFAILGGIAVSLPALTQIGGGGFMAWSIQNGRAGSTFGNPAFLGSYLAVILPLAWASHSRFRWAPIAIIGAALLATGSRGSFAAAAAGVLLIEQLRGRPVARVLAISAPILAVVWFVRHAGAGSDAGRLEIWRIAIMSWKSHPILGWGPDTFSLAFRQFMTQRFIDANGHNDLFIQLSAHSDVLQVLTTMGIVGLAAYAFFYVEAARLLRRAIDTEPEALGIAGAILALFVNAKFNPIPLAVLVISAALMGSIDRAVPEDCEGGSRIPALVGAAAAVFLVIVFSVMCNAERHQRRAENLAQTGQLIESAEQFNQAAQINPFDLYYTQRQLDYFWGVLPKMPGVNKDMLAAFSHNISENIGRLHPRDPTAHELRGLSYLFEGTLLGRDRYWEADHELEVAERLAPHFSRYAKRRAEILESVKKTRS